MSITRLGCSLPGGCPPGVFIVVADIVNLQAVGCGVETGQGQLARTVFVEFNLMFGGFGSVEFQQIDAFVSGVFDQLVDLREHLIVLSSQGGDFVFSSGRKRALGQRPGRYDQRADGFHTFDGCIDQLDRFGHFIFA